MCKASSAFQQALLRSEKKRVVAAILFLIVAVRSISHSPDRQTALRSSVEPSLPMTSLPLDNRNLAALQSLASTGAAAAQPRQQVMHALGLAARMVEIDGNAQSIALGGACHSEPS